MIFCAASEIVGHTAHCLRRQGIVPMIESEALVAVAQDWLCDMKDLPEARETADALRAEPPRGSAESVWGLTYAANQIAAMFDEFEDPDAAEILAARLSWLGECACAAVSFAYPLDERSRVEKREEKWQLKCLRRVLIPTPTWSDSRLRMSLLAG